MPFFNVDGLDELLEVMVDIASGLSSPWTGAPTNWSDTFDWTTLNVLVGGPNVAFSILCSYDGLTYTFDSGLPLHSTYDWSHWLQTHDLRLSVRYSGITGTEENVMPNAIRLGILNTLLAADDGTGTHWLNNGSWVPMQNVNLGGNGQIQYSVTHYAKMQTPGPAPVNMGPYWYFPAPPPITPVLYLAFVKHVGPDGRFGQVVNGNWSYDNPMDVEDHDDIDRIEALTAGLAVFASREFTIVRGRKLVYRAVPPTSIVLPPKDGTMETAIMRYALACEIIGLTQRVIVDDTCGIVEDFGIVRGAP